MSTAGLDPTLFENFDHADVLKRFEKSVLQPDSLNFALDFDDSRASGALDLKVGDLEQLLASKGGSPSTRWINLWAPEKQSDLLEVLAKTYKFSPRLLGLMRTKPVSSLPVVRTSSRRSTHDYQRHWRSSKRTSSDVESHIEMEKQSGHATEVLELNHYRIVSEIWHFFSVDLGQRYVCVGFNSLFNTHLSDADDKKYPPKRSSKPAGKRLWSWLVLCDDGTVISIHENLYPNLSGQGLVDEAAEKRDLAVIRRNTLHVLQGLSKAADATRSDNPLITLTIRSIAQSTTGGNALSNSVSDAPSLLFYYIFDDWYTTYSLVARRDHQYGTQLEQLREAMFKTAELDHVDTLHHYGRQLAVLKRIYQSYDQIIGRIMDMQGLIEKSTLAAASSTQATNATISQVQLPQGSNLDAEDLSYGVRLSTAAIVRFQTLRDRIRLYALSEIQECLDEKEALVQVNFNLINLKESSAVETLTRITILLAKVTILFLPVSLMTSYFALQIPDIARGFSAKTYWISFAVVMVLSFILLLVFGILSGTQESKTVYRSLTRTFFDKYRVAWKKDQPQKDRNE